MDDIISYNNIEEELRIDQIKLKIQNDELRRIKEDLQSSQEKYVDLYDLAPLGYVTMNEKGFIIECNLTSAGLLGITKPEIVNYPLSKFVFTKDYNIYHDFRKKLLETKSTQECELRMVHSNMTKFWVHLKTTVILLLDGSKQFRTVINDINARMQLEENVKSLLKEKEILLKEVHHRIKSNMNIIHDIILLQAGSSNESAVASALSDAGTRVKSMILLYNKLYHSADSNSVSIIHDYLSSMSDEIICCFSEKASIKVEKSIEYFVLDAKNLIPLGLIFNELLTNILKHAFKGKESGLITICASLKKKQVCFTIQDNGIGMPDNIDSKNGTGFGLTLVDLMTKQLKGKFILERDPGTKFTLKFGI